MLREPFQLLGGRQQHSPGPTGPLALARGPTNSHMKDIDDKTPSDSEKASVPAPLHVRLRPTLASNTLRHSNSFKMRVVGQPGLFSHVQVQPRIGSELEHLLYN
eukprot:gnl/TRDRNA2_/TRDRNA2_177610_c2_seq1.p3 gnl/TRDRNA2_/TRDRNA2_177610_c2~~gnl/TRDRNA2_/TRDRNA2_177610_c2_seq1.p3  ORF type:complete len:104 (-),score=3.73 gnl/TRDRNA2_/TRDRNA2_177610_c2_seq1:2561-2872(-)